MLLLNMTPKEMIEEIRKDNEQVYNLNMRFLINGGAKHLRRQGAKFPAYVMRELQSARGNRYLSTFLFRNRGEVFKCAAQESRLALVTGKEGIYGVSLAYSGKFQQEVVYLYYPHVYKRYRERMGLDINGVELIRYFEKRNCDTIFNDGYSRKDSDGKDIMLSVLDGALFGSWEEQDGQVRFVIKTFIANDTMQEGYKSQFNDKYNDAVDELAFWLPLMDGEKGWNFDFHKRRQ